MMPHIAADMRPQQNAVLQDKKDAILAGDFLFRMGGEEVILQAGDTLEVPKGVTHYAEVVGKQACVFVDASR